MNPILLAMLPLLVFAVAQIISLIFKTTKIWIVMMPLLAGSMFVWHPGSGISFMVTNPETEIFSIQAVLMTVWLLIVLGSGTQGIANKKLKISKSLWIIIAVVCVCLGYLLVFQGERDSGVFNFNWFTSLALAFIVFLFLTAVIFFVVCPLFVFGKEQRKSALEDYGVCRPYDNFNTIPSGKNATAYYVQFEDDPEQYRIGWLHFQKTRNKIGVRMA